MADAPATEQRLKQLSEERQGYVAAKTEAVTALKDLEARAAEMSEQLAAERAAHDDTIKRERTQHETLIKSHETLMLRNRAELEWQLDATKNDAAAAAELKSGMEARLSKILAAAS